MSKSNTWETGLLNLLFVNQAFGGVGDTNGLQPSATGGSLYVSLHTADPGEGGDQTTNEITYPGYSTVGRVGVVRTSGGWTVSGAQVSNAGTITFGICTGGSFTASFVGVGTASSGAGKLLYSGELIGAAIVVSVDSTTDTLTATSHGLAGGTAVRLRLARNQGVAVGTVPAGLSEGTQYFVKTSSVTTNTFQLVTASDGTGTAIDITSNGSGQIEIHKDFYLAISNNITPQFAANQLVLIED